MSFAGVTDPLGGKFDTVGGIISALLVPIFALSAMLALLFLIWGGIRYMIARDNPKAVDEARNTIMSAIIGLFVILFIAIIFFLVSATFKIDVFGFLPLASPAHAQGVDIGQTVQLGGGFIGDAFQNFGELFTRIVQATLVAAAVIFFAMMVWGGFRYLNAGGEPKNAAAARQTLTNAGIGLLIVLISFVIIEMLTKLASQGAIF